MFEKLSDLICVLSLSGVQKEDIDVNTLKKLKQHNVNLDDLNNDTIHRDCLANSDILSREKQRLSVELPAATMVTTTEMQARNNQKSIRAAEVPEDIAKLIKYFNVPSIQLARTRITDTNDKLLKDVENYIEQNKITTLEDDRIKDSSAAKNTTFFNPEDMMKFWKMYSNFQQSQREKKNRPNYTTTIFPKEEQNTEKNNIIHITINKYTRNDSFLEQYFADHRNNSGIEKANISSNQIMKKIHNFISRKLFTNEDEASKETTNLNRHKNIQSSKSQVDKTASSNQKTMDKGHEIQKVVLNKIPPLILEEITKEVQDLVLKDLIKNPTTPHTEITKIYSDDKNYISGKDPVNAVMLQNVVNDVKKMLLNELRQESAFKESEITSTSKAVAATETRSNFTVLPNSADPELNQLIKLLKKFKPWKDTSSTSSPGEDFQYESLNNQKSSGVTNKPQSQKKIKINTKLHHRDALQSIQSKGSNAYPETFNSYEYRKPDEQNVIAEDEDQTEELNTKIDIFPLPYMHNSSKNKAIRPDITTDVSEESAYVNDLPTRNEKRHVKKHHTIKDMVQSDSKNTVSQDNYSKTTKIKKQKFYHEYPTNSKEANSDSEKAESSENYDSAETLSDAFSVPVPRRNKDNSKPRKITHHPHRKQKYSANNKNIDASHENYPYSNGIPDYTANNTNKDVQTANTYGSMVRNKQLDDSEVLNKTPHVSQNYGKHSVVKEQIATSISQIKANQNRDASIQQPLQNTPNTAYNPYGYLSGQNQIADAKVLAPGAMPFPMVPYPYALPNYFVNNKLHGSQSPLNAPNTNVITAYNTYGAPGYSVQNSFGIAQEQVRSAAANSPAVTGISNPPNYSKKSITGTGQDPIKFAANSGNDPNPNGYQGAPNYSARNKIGSQQPIAENMEHSNPVAAYPYAPQYSDTNKPGETRDIGSSSKNALTQNGAGNSLNIASNYQTNNKVRGTQAQIPALPLINPNPFGGMFSPKEKFPVIQDPRIETLMKNTNIGPSFNPYLTYPANIQTPMAANVQNLQQLQDIVAPNLAQNYLNMQSKQLSLQNNPVTNINSPGLALNSNKEAQAYQSNTSHKESLKEQNSPYVNSQQPDRRSHDTMSSKQQDTEPQPVHHRANNIAKIYLPNAISKKGNEKVDQKTPIMMQTNDDEIMPLGIPIHIKSESKFNMRLIQNQHIIVTTTPRPRSQMDHWNHYKLTKDSRTKDQTEGKTLSPSAIYHPQQRVRPPMTHHDFEDLPSSQEPSNYYREGFNDMRPRIGLEFESRHKYSPENRLNYNSEMQELGYTRHRSDQPEKVSLFRNQERMHDSINAGDLTIAQRHQVPLKRPQVNFDDTHFQNFLKTQEKVNDILERILATRPKNLRLEPFKNI